MAKMISDEKAAKTVKVLEATLVPKIKKLVDETNAFFKNKGVRVGLELNWILDDISDEKENGS